MSDDSENRAISVIEEQADKTIRRSLVDGVWYFSIVDVVAVLTGSPRPRKYWNALKTSMQQTQGWDEVSQKMGQLKLQAADGKYYRTDAADTATILRIIQSIPSPNAEPIRLWLAKVGAQELAQTYDTVSTAATNLGLSIGAVQRNKPDDNDLLGMADYYQQLSMVYRQQAQLESRLRFVEVATRSQGEDITGIKIRLDELERNQSSLPELLQLLRVELLTPDHQNQVRS